MTSRELISLRRILFSLRILFKDKLLMLCVSTRGNPAKFVVMGRSSLTQECVLNSSKPLLRTLSPPQFPQNNVASYFMNQL